MENTITYEETSSERDGSLVSVKCASIYLNYDLESGEFSKQKEDKPQFKKIPKFFIYDSKYKKGKTLS